MALRLAGQLVLRGIDPGFILDANDPIRAVGLQVAIDHAARLDEEWREDLARRIRNQVGEMLGG